MHIPVLLHEVMYYLNSKEGDVVLDATLGGGGHAKEVLKKIGARGELIAIDKDPEAIERGKELLKDFGDRIKFVNDDFRGIKKILDRLGVKTINGAIFDLGMSSFQVDSLCRGFSFLKDGPLDMRFNASAALAASDVVNKFSLEEIADIIKKYGEERHSRLIAKAILEFRKKKRITTTGELADIVKSAVGMRYRSQRLHPACRSFQALRIFVNDELGALDEALNGIIPYLEPSARLCVISFHSLEDRIVKNIFRDKKRKEEISIVTKKPVVPSREEIAINPRARSAKLRVAERIKNENL